MVDELHFYLLNGKLKQQKILWEDNGQYMKASNTAKLKEKISEQKNGIVLVWSRWDISNNKPLNYGWNFNFIPAIEPLLHEGTGCGFLLTTSSSVSSAVNKYLYIYDDRITGYDANGEGDNRNYVLKRIIGI